MKKKMQKKKPQEMKFTVSQEISNKQDPLNGPLCKTNLGIYLLAPIASQLTEQAPLKIPPASTQSVGSSPFRIGRHQGANPHPV